MYIYDIESFPNAFLVGFKGEGKSLLFDENNLEELREFLHEEPLLVGYNNHYFDDVLLNRILDRSRPLPTAQQLNNLVEILISREQQEERIEELVRGWKWPRWKPYKSIDLLSILTNNFNRPSLEKCAIHLKWRDIISLPFAPGSYIEDRDTLTAYMWNDIDVTEALFKLLLPDIQYRKRLSNQFRTNLTSASNSAIANAIFNSRMRVDRSERTERTVIKGKTLIPPNLDFKTEQLKRLVEDIRGKDFDAKGSKYKKILKIGKGLYTFGAGGMHSNDGAEIFRAAKGLSIVDCDVSSYYPFTILNYNICPAHLNPEEFLPIYRDIVTEKMEAGKRYKETGESHYLDRKQTMKIAANAAFGKFGSRSFWLYDPKCMLQVTFFGQLFLLDLIEKLELGGIEVISANTDGVIAKVNDWVEYRDICREWEQRTRYQLEFSHYELYARLNVNSYLALDKSGKRKLKGNFKDNLERNKDMFQYGFNAPVIALALQAYFIEGIPPAEFIPAHEDVYNFCYTQKVGAQFNLYKWTWLEHEPDRRLMEAREERTKKGNPTANSKRAELELIRLGMLEKRYSKLQKTNRYYVSTFGYYLAKRYVKEHQRGGDELSILKGKTVHLFNNYTEMSSIDYTHYIDEACKLIAKIEATTPKRTVIKEEHKV